MWLWSRGRSWFEAAARRLLSHLDPRDPIVYQRSAVSGHLVGIVVSQDREHVRSVAEHMGNSWNNPTSGTSDTTVVTGSNTLKSVVVYERYREIVNSNPNL